MTLSAKDACRTDLIHRILTLDLAPGVALDETRLSQRYGLSRTPLREVFQGLAGQGYTVIEPHRGTIVAPLGVVQIQHFLRSAPLLSVTAARMAAENPTPEAMASLEQAQDRYASAVNAGDAQAGVLANHSFHMQIARMSGNPYIEPALVRLMTDHTRLLSMFYESTLKKGKKRGRQASDQHDALIAAIGAGDAEAAARIALEHWQMAEARIATLLKPSALPIDLPPTP